MQKTIAGGTREGKDCVAIATRLLDHGAPFEHHRAGDRCTALHGAAEYGDADGVRCLLARGADREAATHARKRPLHGAATRGPVACALALLEAGASVDATTRNGETALHLAAARTRFAKLGSAGLVEALVAPGAYLHVRDGNGWTPLGRALSGLYTPRAALTVRPTQRAVLAALAALVGPCDAVGSWGATLAHVAACRDDADLLSTVLARGAAPAPRDDDGYTPLRRDDGRTGDRSRAPRGRGGPRRRHAQAPHGARRRAGQRRHRREDRAGPGAQCDRGDAVIRDGSPVKPRARCGRGSYSSGLHSSRSTGAAPPRVTAQPLCGVTRQAAAEQRGSLAAHADARRVRRVPRQAATSRRNAVDAAPHPREIIRLMAGALSVSGRPYHGVRKDHESRRRLSQVGRLRDQG